VECACSANYDSDDFISSLRMLCVWRASLSGSKIMGIVGMLLSVEYLHSMVWRRPLHVDRVSCKPSFRV
jgi:hypothetical protein